MFDTSVIRTLANSEEMLAETQNFVGLAAHVTGPIDVDALSAAYDALLAAHPILTSHLEPLPDGRHQFVTDDLMSAGIEVIDLGDSAEEPPPPRFDQNESLVAFRLIVRGDRAQPTLYVHHALADGHHMYALVEELLSYYTDLVETGGTDAIEVQPAPQSIEAVLADRRVRKQQRSGIERFLPAMFGYDLPPTRRAGADVKPTEPVRVPMASARLTEQQTDGVVAFGKAHDLSLHAVLSAAVLLAEWRLRGRLNIPIPYLYTVDLRYFLSPPVSATGCTNPIGVAAYLAEIDEATGTVELARAVAETFQKDLADGVIQQSRLHLSPQYVGNPPGLPDVVVLSNNGLVPPVRTPPGVQVTSTHGELYFTVSAGIDIYFTQIYAGQLNIEYHSHGPAPERSVAAITAQLCSIADQHTPAGLS